MIRKIEHWSLNRIIPTINDTESLTVLELVGKNTTKINEIVDLVNNHIDTVNTLINDFIENTSTDLETFKIQMEQKFKDFADIIDLKIDSQDKLINDTIVYIKNNLHTYIVENFQTTIEEMIKDGTLKLVLNYDSETETLILDVSQSEV